jgi:hypothetical protein
MVPNVSTHLQLTLCSMVDELVAQRALLERFGTDMRSIALRSRTSC